MDLASYQIKKMDIKDSTQSQKLDHEVKIAQRQLWKWFILSSNMGHVNTSNSCSDISWALR